MCRVAVVLGEELARYHFPPPHPFSLRRYTAFEEAIEELREPGLVKVRPRTANEEELELFHEREYIQHVKLASKMGRGYLDAGDTPSFPGIFEASCYTVGSSLLLLEKVLSREVEHGFNPVGGLHHAARRSAAGFCVFNDVGVVIERARKLGLRRILYVDIDAHHGDGVFYAYEGDPDVWILDLHEDGRFLYPGTGFAQERGSGAAAGTKLNIPLPPGAGDGAFLEAFERAKPFLKSAEPELILLQAGADGLEGDPLTHLRYTPAVHGAVARYLHGLAHSKAEGRLIVFGGGGYNPDNVARAWVSVIKALLQGE
jgi:acetoin utilization protein AcuC